jgi:methylmalonyl-CoA mutase
VFRGRGRRGGRRHRYVEDLTEQLAARAWACFQDIERAGGLRAALDSGLIAGQLAASRQVRRDALARPDALARRREVITGVTEFPLVGEVLLDRPPYLVPDLSGGLPRIRWAQWHEELRDRADAYARATGAPPTVTLVLLDASRSSAAVAGRVTAVLATVGIATVTADGVVPGAVIVCGDPGEVGAADFRARADGASVVVAADEVLADGVDIVAFGDRMLTALGVA